MECTETSLFFSGVVILLLCKMGLWYSEKDTSDDRKNQTGSKPEPEKERRK